MRIRSSFLAALAAFTLPVLSAPAAPSGLILNVLYSFTNGASSQAGLLPGTNGQFYGTLATGGTSNFGGVFEIAGNGALITNIWLGGANGAAPVAPLIQDKAGNLYGTASSGGTASNGTVFEITAGKIKVLGFFNDANGSMPLAPLLLGTDGWLYGTTYYGGTNGLGTIFRVAPGQGIQSLFSFAGTNGANPRAGLIQGSDGNLYGTTAYGGDGGIGTAFQLTNDGGLATICSFTNDTGAFPGGLVEDSRSNFYGAALSGGSAFAGTLFRISSSGTLQAISTFSITNGASPNSPLVLGQDGGLYGTTEDGGAFGQGVIFSESKYGFLTNLVSFDGTNGAAPLAGVIAAPDGNYYGTTSLGGANGLGVIYQLTGFPPFIIQAPVSKRWLTNGTALFSVEAGGTAPLSYQWWFDGTNMVPGATNASLTISHEQLTNSGTYTVVISNAYGVISNQAALTLPAPTVTIKAPPATVSNATLTISGTAADPYGVATVLYQLNSNGWFAAIGTKSWQADVTLAPGTNFFMAQSFDPVGDPSAIRSARVFYATASPLTLITNGLGSILAEFKGTNLFVGRDYTVRAMPAPGWLFLSWTGSENSTSETLDFMMQSNAVLSANFITNPFIAAAGTYQGLFFDSVAVGFQSAGLLRNMLIHQSGAYSGQIVVKGIAYGFTGSFDASEQSSPTVQRLDKQGGPMTMNLTLSGSQVSGTISGTDDGGWTSTLLAERTVTFGGSFRYTALIPPGPAAPSNCPPGDGYLLLTNDNGAVSLSGAVADGATFDQNQSVVGGGDVPLYASLYGNNGMLLGWLNLNGGLTATNLWWIKMASSSSLLYTNGFTNLVTNLPASLWTKPSPDFFPSGSLTITNGGPALDFGVAITNTSLVERSGLSNSLTGLFYPNTGLLRISFRNGTGNSTTTGYAAFLQDSTNGGGYFVTKSNAGAVLIGP
jgi:uncharacterized repeat protein (TIGR03803 family)